MTFNFPTRRIVLVAALTLSVACSPVIRNHGYVPLEEELSLLTVGVDTRQSVTDLVGPPSSGGVLQGGNHYYVSNRFRHLGAFAPQEISREVVAISFDEGGVLTNIERFGLEDGQIVALSRRVTDSPVQNSTFLRQLLGSLGNFDASTAFGGS